MRQSQFIIEVTGDEAFEGYTESTLWNGWACPFFDFANAQRIVAAFAPLQEAAYDADLDEFVFASEDGEERFGAVEIEGAGKLYPIGAGTWIWEEKSENS